MRRIWILLLNMLVILCLRHVDAVGFQIIVRGFDRLGITSHRGMKWSSIYASSESWSSIICGEAALGLQTWVGGRTEWKNENDGAKCR